ncbi:peptidase E [Phototrophicus methaneseepsis]|uniref:Peptidase E n=1 Tax=Phototrophicus methaneseepsis TaxID=2710758 RepID=A0A7S8ECK3_9CHLR|nr:peptidase E [Phototrophicus methaneseepsis]QPC84364.1 peptidase E [Phototrophicus methaneseepsis]
MALQIIAMGGGGFSMEPDNLALDRYVIQQTDKAQPRVCFLGQASSESQIYIINFYNAFNRLDCKASHLSLFQPHTADIEDFLCSQDIIYVGGGNTRSMLAVWREWGLDTILKTAGANGTVLAGISAGAICWHDYGLTDSIPGRISALKCLGYIEGTCSPHYDGEPERRPAYHEMVRSGEVPAGIALDDGAAVHYMDGERYAVVSSRPDAKGYWLEKQGDTVSETPLETRYLLPE